MWTAITLCVCLLLSSTNVTAQTCGPDVCTTGCAAVFNPAPFQNSCNTFGGSANSMSFIFSNPEMITVQRCFFDECNQVAVPTLYTVDDSPDAPGVPDVLPAAWLQEIMTQVQLTITPEINFFLALQNRNSAIYLAAETTETFDAASANALLTTFQAGLVQLQVVFSTLASDNQFEIYLSVASGPAPTIPPQNAVCVGSEIKDAGQVTASEAECEALCANFELCSAHTWWELTGWCRLCMHVDRIRPSKFKTLTGQRDSQCAALATKSIFDVLSAGNPVLDRINTIAAGRNEEDCCQACLANSACAAFTWKFKGKCVLFSAFDNNQLTTSKKFAVSGIVLRG